MTHEASEEDSVQQREASQTFHTCVHTVLSIGGEEPTREIHLLGDLWFDRCTCLQLGMFDMIRKHELP